MLGMILYFYPISKWALCNTREHKYWQQKRYTYVNSWILYLVLMKQVQASSQVLSSSNSAAFSSCCSSSFCPSAKLPRCGEQKSRNGERSRTHCLHFILFVITTGFNKEKERKMLITCGCWFPSHLWCFCSPAAADMSVPGCTSATGWRAASYTAAAKTTSWIPSMQNADIWRPLYFN